MQFVTIVRDSENMSSQLATIVRDLENMSSQLIIIIKDLLIVNHCEFNNYVLTI